MIRVLRMSDRIKIKLDELTFYLAPLSNAKKMEISGCTMIKNGEPVYDVGKAQALYVKYSLKKVEGLKDYHGEDYELEFEGDALTDDCVSEIFTIEESPRLMHCAWSVLNGVPDKITDDNGNPLQGVALEVVKAKKPEE